MKAKIKIEQQVDIKTLHVEAGVRYWEDSTVNGIKDEAGDLIPCRDGNYWKPIIDIDSGKITNWTAGVVADIHYKVCDDGTYRLYDELGDLVVTKEGYVPNIMCPEDNGYGDYIIMKVDENGVIANWQPVIDDFIEDEN